MGSQRRAEPTWDPIGALLCRSSCRRAKAYGWRSPRRSGRFGALGLCSGGRSALEVLYGRYGGLIFTLALRIVGDPELAREVLQDTFLRCWDGRDAYDPARGRVPGWLMGIARNRAIDLLRSRPHQARLREREPLEGLASEPVQPDAADSIMLRRAVVSALRGLPIAQRQAIELAYYGGHTQVEIARELGEPLGTTRAGLGMRWSSCCRSLGRSSSRAGA